MRCLLSTCHDRLFILVFLINIVAERKFALWLIDAIPQFWGLAYWRHLVNPLPISQRHGEKHIQAFDNFWAKCTSAQNCVHLLFGQSSLKCRELVKQVGDAHNFSGMFSEITLPENIFYLLAMKASTCHHLWRLDKGVISNETLQTAGGFLQLSNGCGINLVPESWHELFLHTRLPFYPPQRFLPPLPRRHSTQFCARYRQPPQN